MIQSLQKPEKTTMPNQTRLMAEYMLNSYKQRIEQRFENDSEKMVPAMLQPTQTQEFMSARLIRLLKRKIKEKTKTVKRLQSELSSAEHIINAEEHLRKKFEAENAKLKREKEILLIANNEETTMLTLALNKYRDEKNRYCTQLQEASTQITALEFELKDKKQTLQNVAQDLMHAKSRLRQEACVRQNRDMLIHALEKEKTFLLHARKEETQALHTLYTQHKRTTSALKAGISHLREKIHFLEIEAKDKDQEIARLKETQQHTENVRQEESDALLFFLEKYRELQKKQQASILEMKKEMYQEGLHVGSIVQNY